jgi:hypothetical protein
LETEDDIEVLKRKLKDAEERERSLLLAKQKESQHIDEEKRVSRVDDAKKKSISNEKQKNNLKQNGKKNSKTIKDISKENKNTEEEDNEKDKAKEFIVADKELENKDEAVVWDIVLDKSYPYEEYEPDRSSLSRQEKEEEDKYDEVVGILNIRKQKGNEAQVLCEYKFGTRWWCEIGNAFIDKKNLVYNFLERRNIGEGKVGYNIPKRSVRDKKQGNEPVSEEKKKKECSIDHDNWLNYDEEGDCGYCKCPYHFFGVHCVVCEKEFTYEKNYDGTLLHC